MRGIVLVGTSPTRPGAIGTLWRLEHGSKEFKPVEGIPQDTWAVEVTPHPEKPNVVFAATKAGIFKSEDEGRTWTKKFAAEGKGFWSVVFDPKNANRLVAGTAPVDFYISEDGGETWTKSFCDQKERFTISFGGSRAMRIAFHPTNPNILYAGAEINGLLVSTDGGKTWHDANEGVLELSRQEKYQHIEVTKDGDPSEGMHDAHAVMTTPANPDAVYYACRMGVFTSDDLGKTLKDLEVGKYAPFKYTRDLRFNPQDPNKLYVCFSISSRSEAGAMFRSPDLGRSWERFFPQENARSTIMGFGTHVTEPGGVAAVTRHFQVFYTMDDGRSWNEVRLPDTAGDGFCATIL